jgi:DNA-binding NarL/FixJ family response regulator
VLVLTHSDQNRVVEAIIAGASGYILKTAPSEQIVRAIRATAAGESVLSPQIAGKLLEHVRRAAIPVIATSQTDADSIRAALTRRELEIFAHLASGKTNRQIGDEFSLSTNTVRNHIKSILDKLHLENRIQAAAHAVRAGIS